MLDFTALDFETANAYPNSACSLAAVTMHDAACVKEGYSLIRPPFMVFAPETVRIHGITPDMVAGKPKFNALWPAIRRHLDGRILAAPNAAFDMRVLRSLLSWYDLEPPQASYICTVQLSRRIWPELPSHRLDVVAGHLGYTFRHHQALDDARACAYIVVKAAEKTGARSMEELIEQAGVRLKSL